MNKISFLSILVPVYNEEDCLDTLYNRLSSVLKNISCKAEILFVNDGSSDRSLEIIKKLQKKDPRVVFLDLSRNYGKETAMAAGIDYIRGDALAIIDADLQDPPELIPLMIQELENGYDDVYAQRSSRKGETLTKRATSKIYYNVLSKVSAIPIQLDTGDYRLLSKRAIDALKSLKEYERNTKGLFSYIGFKKKAVRFERDPRIAGETKWNYFKLFDLAVKGITSFSVLPLRIISVTGLLVSILSFVYMGFVITKALLVGDPVAGYPSIMAVMLFIGGIQLLALGFIGEYVGIIYSETKKRPLYFVDEYGKIESKKGKPNARKKK